MKPEYLTAAFDAVKQNYGSLDNYYVKGLNVTPDQLATLRGTLVERN